MNTLFPELLIMNIIPCSTIFFLYRHSLSAMRANETDASHIIKCNENTFVFAFSYFLRWFDLVWFMVFDATFNNISVISWRSVLLVPGENHRPVASH